MEFQTDGTLRLCVGRMQGTDGEARALKTCICVRACVCGADVEAVAER